MPAAAPSFEKLMQKSPRPTDHLAITLGPFFIVLFDLVVPCIIYYVWYNTHHHSHRENDCNASGPELPKCSPESHQINRHILGYAIVSFGIGELYILIARVCRLFLHPDECAPLLSRSRWELDATSWVYGVSMICALIPFVISSSQEMPILFLYSPAFLLGFLAILMLITLVPFRIPIGIDSQPRGTPLRPLIYYAAEDFMAVDFLQDRDFRIRYNLRYEQSKAFRRMLFALTLWWLFGVCVYLGSVSAVIWTLQFHYAFGLSLGVLFAFLGVWGGGSYLGVKMEIDREVKTGRSV